MKIKKFENINVDSLENEIYDYLKQRMEEDLSDGDSTLTKMEEFDQSWLTDELIQFIDNNIVSSYVLLKYGKQKSHEELESILKNLFPIEYKKAFSIVNEFKFENTWGEIPSGLLNTDPKPKSVSDPNNIQKVNKNDLTLKNSPVDDEGNVIKKFSDLTNWSPRYHVNKAKGLLPYKKEKRVLIKVEDGETIPQNALYLKPDDADKYNDLTENIIKMEEERDKILK